MYGRFYTILVQEIAVSAAQDLLEITVPSDAAMVLHSAVVTQSSDAGDAESEQINVAIKRGVGITSGSGGGAVTPAKLSTGDAAAGITAERNNTTQASGGTITVIYDESFNVMAGMQYAPEKKPVFSPSEVCLVALDTAPTDALTVSVSVLVEEIGG